MSARTPSGSVLPGDWRSSAYGAARVAHLFVVRFGESRKRAACGARIDYSKTGRRAVVPANHLCYDCLAHGASGR